MMGSTPQEIASLWEEQMQRGYLKLAILFSLTKGPLHGYQMMRRINELTMGMVKPTAGGMYPALKELEERGLITGDWHPKERRKVYRISERGREVFREVVEKHLDLASSVRSWILKALTDLKILENEDASPVLMPAIQVLLLREDASNGERIEALNRLKIEFQRITLLLKMMMGHIEERTRELKGQ
jgi:PadR family transcriptional regulator PadR